LLSEGLDSRGDAPCPCDCAGLDWADFDFPGLDIPGFDFTGFDLSGAVLRGFEFLAVGFFLEAINSGNAAGEDGSLSNHGCATAKSSLKIKGKSGLLRCNDLSKTKGDRGQTKG
jgi:hypothetical protein